MKVKCIKDTIGFKEGEVYETENGCLISADMDLHFWKKYTEYFQEQEEEKEEKTIKPRWKVGDYVVRERIDNSNIYTKILCISGYKTDGYGFLYNDNFISSDLRSPTQEELKLYFR